MMGESLSKQPIYRKRLVSFHRFSIQKYKHFHRNELICERAEKEKQLRDARDSKRLQRKLNYVCFFLIAVHYLYGA